MGGVPGWLVHRAWRVVRRPGGSVADSPEDAAADVLVGGGARVAGSGRLETPQRVGLGSAGLWVPVFWGVGLKIRRALGQDNSR